MITPRLALIESVSLCDGCRFRLSAPLCVAHLPGVVFIGCQRGDCDNWLQKGHAVPVEIAQDAAAPENPAAPE